MVCKIAICENKKIFNHSETWTRYWTEYCQLKSFTYESFDPYSYDAIEKMHHFDILLWHPHNYVLADMMEARNLLYAAQRLGLLVFPDFNTVWHFDDKIAESYLLRTVNAPVPDSWVFYLLDDAVEWLNKEARFPIIGKLKSGSGSSNVKLLHSRDEAINYARKMFGRGFKPAPSFLYKAKSKIRSTHDWKTFLSRARRIPEFFHTLSRASAFPREHGYAYVQEFIPNDGYDLKVVVIGDKVSGFARKVRKNDFRASGGGDIIYNNELVTEEIREISLKISKDLDFQCMGFDFVVNNETNKGYIVEMCFGFSNDALLDVGGYWDSNNTWINEPLNAPVEVLENLLRKYERNQNA